MGGHEVTGPAGRRRHVVWGIGVAATLLIFQLGAKLVASSTFARHLWSNLWWTATSLIAALVCLNTALHMRVRHLRIAWFCYAMGALAWFIGMVIWDFDELMLGIVTPFPTVADLFFNSIVVFFIAGTFFYKAEQPSATLNLKQAGDLGIISSALVIAAIDILYLPAKDASGDLVYVIIALGYPVLHLSALLFGLICLWQHVWGGRRIVLGLQLTAMGILAMVTTLYAESLLAHRYEAGAWIDVFWVAAFSCITWAAREEVHASETEDLLHGEEVSRFDVIVPILAILSWILVEVSFSDHWAPALVPVQAMAGGGLVASLALRLWATQKLEHRLLAQVRREEGWARRLQTQLFHAQKMEAVGTLAGGVAHDFNNLLHAAVASVGLLRRKLIKSIDRGTLTGPGAWEAGGFGRDLDEIERALWRAADLTARLLSVAKKREPKRIVVDPAEAVGHVASLLGKVLPKNIRLDVRASEPVSPIEVDPAGLEHALLNLGLNARDAMRDKGGTLVIELGTSQDIDGLVGDVVTITVRDTGPGIAPDLVPRVFEPFFTTKEHGEGTGLGLAMVDAFAAENGGIVTVDSKIGRGAVFRLAFPSKIAREPTAEILPSLSGTVMVVDLGDSSGLAATGVLERCGLETIVVSSPEAAVEAAGKRRGDIEVVVADAASGMAGREAVRALREAGVGAPIILIAGADGDPSGDWAAVVRKPVDPRALAEAVKDAVNHRAASSSGSHSSARM